MNTNSKRLSIYTIIMLVITSVAVTMRTIDCITNLNGGTGYFSKGSLSSISTPMIWVVVLASFSYIFTASKTELRPSFSTAATYVPTGILGVSTLFLGVRILSNAINLNPYYPFLSVETLTDPRVILSLIAFVLSIVSIGYFFFNVYTTESKTDVRAAFAVGIIAFFAIYAMLIYFDKSLPINNPGKTLNQMAYLFAAAFFLYETRISLGREMWRLYSAFALATAALTAYTSIPAIITYYVKGYVIFGSQNEAFISLEEYMLTFALFIYVTAKLFLTITLKEECPNEFVNAITAYAAHRENEVADSLEQFEQDFAAKQLSIFELYGEDDVNTAEAEEIQEQKEEEKPEEKVVMISDDAIYEAIFGKMPEKIVENEDTEAKTVTSEEDTDEEVEVDTEAVVDNLLAVLEEADGNETKNKQG